MDLEGSLKAFALTFLLLGGFLSIYLVSELETEDPQLRSPASIPENYESLSACQKQDFLWNEAEVTAYQELPPYQKFGFFQLVKLSLQSIATKGNLHSDVSPKGWKKYLHRRGALAKVKIVARSKKYSGIFQGAECALLRLSLTYKVKGARPFAPGLALKVLRDGVPSANISALVSLDGQDKDYNFFKNPMSNIVPTGNSLGQKLVHKIFRKVTKYPEELLASDMALVNALGEKSQPVVSPRQIFFVPGPGLNVSSEPHDVREDFVRIPKETLIYKIYAVSEKHKDFQYSEYTDAKVSEFLKDSEHVADIVTTSEFVTSQFGDEGIFFRHQLRPRK